MNPKDEWCSMCYSPNVIHIGGLVYKNQRIDGCFCSEECFNRWVIWKTCFIEWCKK